MDLIPTSLPVLLYFAEIIITLANLYVSQGIFPKQFKAEIRRLYKVRFVEKVSFKLRAKLSFEE